MHKQTHEMYRVAMEHTVLTVQTMQIHTNDKTMLDDSHGYCRYVDYQLGKRCSTLNR